MTSDQNIIFHQLYCIKRAHHYLNSISSYLSIYWFFYFYILSSLNWILLWSISTFYSFCLILFRFVLKILFKPLYLLWNLLFSKIQTKKKAKQNKILSNTLYRKHTITLICDIWQSLHSHHFQNLIVSFFFFFKFMFILFSVLFSFFQTSKFFNWTFET